MEQENERIGVKMYEEKLYPENWKRERAAQRMHKKIALKTIG